MQSVLVTRRLPPRAAQLLQQRAAGARVSVRSWDGAEQAIPREQLLVQSRGVAGLLCMLTDRVDAELLHAMGPQLRVVSTMSVGVDHVDVRACTAAGVCVGHTPGVLTDAVADLTVALLLAALRRLPEALATVTQGKWGTWSPLWMCGRGLKGAVVGVVGYGRIGQAVVQRLHPFGIASILYSGASGPKKVSRVGDLELQFRALPQLLAEADVVIAACDLNENTRLMFNKTTFAQMKPGGVFVNTSRGGVVDQAALAEALRSRHLWAAALDVTTPEPLPCDHELTSLSNCIIAPHIGSATIETREEMARLAVENLFRGIDQQPLLHEFRPRPPTPPL